MIFRPFYYDDLGCCGTVGRCAVVDPRVEDVDSYVAFAAAKKMQIVQVIDTHVHADVLTFLSGVVVAARMSETRPIPGRAA